MNIILFGDPPIIPLIHETSSSLQKRLRTPSSFWPALIQRIVISSSDVSELSSSPSFVPDKVPSEHPSGLIMGTFLGTPILTNKSYPSGFAMLYSATGHSILLHTKPLLCIDCSQPTVATVNFTSPHIYCRSCDHRLSKAAYSRE